MRDYPKLVCPPPGPRARAIMARDARTMSQNYRKDYPLVVDRAAGPVVVENIVSVSRSRHSTWQVSGWRFTGQR